MKIYLAGNFAMMNQKNREKETCHKFKTWKRLFSFYYLELIQKSNILKIKQEYENK